MITKSRTLGKTAVLFGLLLCSTPVSGSESPDLPSISIGGLMFGDLYAVPSDHLEAGDGAAGLVVRRGYLTLDADFSARTFGRLRFELNQSGDFETYTFDAKVKDLHLGWNLGRQRLIAGLTSTITFDLTEGIWGFRHLARTPLDLQGVASRDTGVSAKGPLNAAGTLLYRAMFGSGVQFEADSSKDSKWMGALTWKPGTRWTLDFYGDYESMKDGTNGSMLQAFAAYQSASLRWGLQYSNQEREQGPEIDLVSGFLVSELTGKTSLVGRVDRLLKPSPKGNDISYLPMDPTAKATMFFGGVQYQFHPNLAVLPNFVVTAYGRNETGARPKTDFYIRLTLFINFE